MQQTTTPKLEIHTSQIAEGVLVRVVGDAGIGEAPALSAALMKLNAARPQRVVFDLAELRFISSLALGMLVEFNRAMARHGCSVRFAAAQPSVHHAFIHARLETVLKLFNTVDEAMKPA